MRPTAPCYNHYTGWVEGYGRLRPFRTDPAEPAQCLRSVHAINALLSRKLGKTLRLRPRRLQDPGHSANAGTVAAAPSSMLDAPLLMTERSSSERAVATSFTPVRRRIVCTHTHTHDRWEGTLMTCRAGANFRCRLLSSSNSRRKVGLIHTLKTDASSKSVESSRRSRSAGCSGNVCRGSC